MNKILLTGASGFIGSHIAEYFSSKGEQLKCLVRENSDISFLKTLNVEIIYGDICDKGSIERAIANCNTVIHTAGIAKDWGSKESFTNNNVSATLNVIETSKKCGIEKIIITGSISSYGEENCAIKKNEESPFKSHYPYFMDFVFPCKMNNYRDSKAILTQKAIEFSKKENTNLIIIEPTWVFGEREFNTGFYEYLKAVKEGSSFFPGSYKNKFHVIYAADLARAYYYAFKKDIKGCERIIVGTPEAEYQHIIYKMFCEKAELKKPKNIAKTVIYPVAFIMELFATVFNTKNPPLLTRGRVNMFYDNIEYDVSKAKTILGFETEFGLEEAIKKTVNWYKLNGYL